MTLTPIVTPAEMGAIDAAAPEPLDELIARAATAVAWEARRMLGGVYGRRVTVIAGPGNNGADARGAATILARWGVRTRVFGPHVDRLPECDLVIDGAFGTGLSRPYSAPHIPRDTPTLAVDIPSGVHGHTGELLGLPLVATRTITFAALKPGLVLHPGAQFAGEIVVADIGLDVASARTHQVTRQWVKRTLRTRPVETHKWERAVTVIGGSTGMSGAPMLASLAALRAGAGLVRCVLPGASEAPAGSEVIFVPEAEDGWHAQVLADANRFRSLVIGPGLGQSDGARRSLRALLDAAPEHLRIVIDGDALRLLGQCPTLGPSVVLTPHDGEYTAIFGSPPEADRFAAARHLSVATGAVVLLKGPTTIVAEPSGRCLASTHGDQRLATAGSGDVLAGIIGAFLAGGVFTHEVKVAQTAAAAAAWVHAEAARGGPAVGLIASDLLAGLPVTLSDLISPD